MKIIDKKNTCCKSSGYTLVEILVAIQIFTIIISMLYTVYLQGMKFMDRWDEYNTMQSTSLSIQRILFNIFSSTEEITSISENNIILFSNHKIKKNINWNNNSLSINSIQLNKSNIKITIKGIRFYSFAENNLNEFQINKLDFNNDGKISQNEFNRILAVKFFIVINSYHFSEKLDLLYLFPKLRGKYLILGERF